MKNKISVNIMGGLGNQMFQYAYAYNLIKSKLSHTHTIEYNTEWYNYKKDNRVYLLDFFNLSKLLLKSDLKNNSTPYQLVLDDKTFDEYKDYKGLNLLLNGYWQKWDHVKKNLPELLNIFKFDVNKIHHGIKDCDKLVENTLKKEFLIKNSYSTSVHVRRGDYLSHKDIYNILDENYYIKAINSEIDKNKNCIFYIFSDDIQWCRNTFKDVKNLVFIGNDPNNPYSSLYDLYLMSICKNNIISNSTFSWWASILNKNNHKTVYAPSTWFVNGLDILDFGCNGELIYL